MPTLAKLGQGWPSWPSQAWPTWSRNAPKEDISIENQPFRLFLRPSWPSWPTLANHLGLFPDAPLVPCDATGDGPRIFLSFIFSPLGLVLRPSTFSRPAAALLLPCCCPAAALLLLLTRAGLLPMVAHSYRPVAPTNAADEDVPDDGSDDSDVPYDPSLPPLDDRVISVVRSSPDCTIRPARLSSELGISVEDATAELCGLLRAVGGGEDGASFRFEEVGANASTTTAASADGSVGAKMKSRATATTMVFTFPPDFEALAKRFRRKK